jgi:hypothetical protein
MSFTTAALDAHATTVEVISAKDFVEMTPQRKAEIKSARIEPPKLGSKSFGGIRVEYKSPKYVVR